MPEILNQNILNPDESKQETMKPKWPPEPDENAEDRVSPDVIDGGSK